MLGAVALIGSATLTGSGDSVPPPWCLPCALRNQGLAADSLLNVLLFVPLGLGLRLAGLGPAAVGFAALAVSLAVEMMQAYAVAGRVANVVDVLTNTMGALLAAMAAPRWRMAVLPSAKAATGLAAVSMTALVAIAAASAWALTPAIPPAPLIVRGVGGRGTPPRPERVLNAVVDGRPVRSRDTVRAPGAHAKPIEVEAELQASRSRWRSDPAVSLVADGQSFVRLGIDDNELELEVRRKGEAARFLSPSVRLPRPGRRPEGSGAALLDTLRLRGVAARWRMGMAVQMAATRDDADMRLHVLSGWSLIVRAPQSRRLGGLLTALWASALVVPVAYWSATAAARRSRVAIGAGLIGTAVGVWAAGAALGAPCPPPSAVISAVVAALGAWRLQRAVHKHDEAPPHVAER